jgi:tight adherence protein C
VSVGLVWVSLAPSQPALQVRARLDGYLARSDSVEAEELQQPFTVRALLPFLRSILRVFGALVPSRDLEATRRMLLQAGQPFGLTVLDFWGLRVLSVVLVGGGYFLFMRTGLSEGVLLRNTLIACVAGVFLPVLWLRSAAGRRMHEVQRALPDALDMLTIGVEAGLAFESALLQVSRKWDNALSRELRRTVAEMRVGTPRDAALQRLADRTAVPDLRTFVAVLVQSNQLGVSIAKVLHDQAAQMRVKRRQRAQELAQQAGVKLVFPLVFLIFPTMFIVILGPSVPLILDILKSMNGS